MDLKCDRCGYDGEYLPTHQMIKFEDDVHYVCQACWELFKGWYYRGARAVETRPDSSRNPPATRPPSPGITYVGFPTSPPTP